MIGVFPKGARFPRWATTAHHKTQWPSAPYHKEVNMNPVYNTPNWAFLVQVTRPHGSHVEYQYVEQLVTHPTHQKCVERVQNQVNERLHALSKRTGLNYFVVAEGPPETVKRIMKAQEIEVS